MFMFRTRSSHNLMKCIRNMKIGREECHAQILDRMSTCPILMLTIKFLLMMCIRTIKLWNIEIILIEIIIISEILFYF